MRASVPALVLPVLLVACASFRVSTDHDPRIDFRRLERFAWLEEPLRELPRATDAPPTDPFARNTLLDQRLRAAVETELEARGYERVERAEADFLLRYQVVAREVIDSAPALATGYGIGGPAFLGGYYGGVYSYQRGTLVIDVIDPRTDRIAWRGWADRRSRAGHHVDAERLLATVDDVLERFPPDR